MSDKRLYLVRHGRQDDAKCNVNVPLALEGEHQAQLLGERLRTDTIDAL